MQNGHDDLQVAKIQSAEKALKLILVWKWRRELGLNSRPRREKLVPKANIHAGFDLV